MSEKDTFALCTKNELRIVRIKRVGKRVKVIDGARISFNDKPVKSAIEISNGELLVAVNSYDHLKIVDIATMKEIGQISNNASASTSYYNLKKFDLPNSKSAILLKDRANISLVNLDSKTITPLVKSKYERDNMRAYNFEAELSEGDGDSLTLYSLEFSQNNSKVATYKV